MEYLLFGIIVVAIIGTTLWGRNRESIDQNLNRLLDAYRLGDGVEGDRLLEEARRSFTTTRGRLRIIEVLFQARAWPQAMEVTQSTRQKAPGNKRLRRYEARLAGALMADDAANLMREWLHDHPGDDRLLLDLAQVYYRRRWQDELLELLIPYVKSQPDSREAQSLLGRAYFAAGELEHARDHLEQAQRMRGLADRHRVAVYGFMGGAEHEVTADEQVQALDDARLLEQIADGSATSKTATFREVENDSGEEEAAIVPVQQEQASDSM